MSLKYILIQTALCMIYFARHVAHTLARAIALRLSRSRYSRWIEIDSIFRSKRGSARSYNQSFMMTFTRCWDLMSNQAHRATNMLPGYQDSVCKSHLLKHSRERLKVRVELEALFRPEGADRLDFQSLLEFEVKGDCFNLSSNPCIVRTRRCLAPKPFCISAMPSSASAIRPFLLYGYSILT